MNNWFIESIEKAEKLEESKNAIDKNDLQKCQKALITKGIKHWKNEGVGNLEKLPPEYLDYLLSRFEKFIESEGDISLEHAFGLTSDRCNQAVVKSDLYFIAMSFSTGFINGTIDRILEHKPQSNLAKEQLKLTKRNVIIEASLSNEGRTINAELCKTYGYISAYTDRKTYCKARITEFFIFLFSEEESNAKRKSSSVNNVISRYKTYYEELKTIEKNNSSIDIRRTLISGSSLLKEDCNLITGC